MSTERSPKQLGQRIREIRKTKGFSQQELADGIQISRSSLAQIELGNRNLNIQELQRVANVLRFSLDDFIAEEFFVQTTVEEPAPIYQQKSVERISVPSLQVAKFKNVLLYILERCAGKANVGETVLYKLLYFSDFNYYELYEEQLTGATYRKLPYGPVPQNLDSIIAQMLEQQELKRIKTNYHGYGQTRYLPLIKPDLTQLKASEKDTIDRVIEQMSDWSAASISNYSHQDMPWLASQQGEPINYELVFYRDIPYSVRNYGDEIEQP